MGNVIVNVMESDAVFWWATIFRRGPLVRAAQQEVLPDTAVGRTNRYVPFTLYGGMGHGYTHFMMLLLSVTNQLVDPVQTILCGATMWGPSSCGTTDQRHPWTCWLRHVEIFHSRPSLPDPGWRTAQRTAWTGAPLGLRVTFTAGPTFGRAASRLDGALVRAAQREVPL